MPKVPGVQNQTTRLTAPHAQGHSGGRFHQRGPSRDRGGQAGPPENRPLHVHKRAAGGIHRAYHLKSQRRERQRTQTKEGLSRTPTSARQASARAEGQAAALLNPGQRAREASRRTAHHNRPTAGTLRPQPTQHAALQNSTRASGAPIADAHSQRYAPPTGHAPTGARPGTARHPLPRRAGRTGAARPTHPTPSR